VVGAVDIRAVIGTAMQVKQTKLLHMVVTK